MENYRQQEKEKIIHVLSNRHRLKIVEALITSKDGLCVGEISELVNISQALASQHMSYLRMQGVATSERDGRTVCYMLIDNALTIKITKILSIL